MEVSTPRPTTPGKRLVIPHYEDTPRAFGGRGTLSHPAAPSRNMTEQAILERRMPSARSFSPNYRSRTPLLFSRRSTLSRPGSSESRTRSTTPQASGRVRQRPSTADNALRDVSRPIGNRPGTADRPGYRTISRPALPTNSQESTSYSKSHVHMQDPSLKENGVTKRSVTYPTLGVSRPASSRRAKDKSSLLSATVPVGSLIKAKATNTLQVYKKGIIDVIKDYNLIKDEVERKKVLLSTLEGTSKELERHAAYTASVAAPDNAAKLKAKTIAKELDSARGKSQNLGIFHFQLEFVQKRIEMGVIVAKQNVDRLTNILEGANNCKTDIALECRSVKDQRHLAVSSVKDVRHKKLQRAKYHDLEISAMKKVIKNKERWTQWEAAWKKRETERPKRNDLKSAQLSSKDFSANFVDKAVAVKMTKLIERLGLDEHEIYDYLMDYPNKLREFQEMKEETEARLSEVNKELKYATRELADYKRDLRQASTKKFSELESKLSTAEEIFKDKHNGFKDQMQLFANLQSWTNEMSQRLMPLVEEGGPKDQELKGTTNEDVFVARLKQIDMKLGILLEKVDERKNRTMMTPSAGSPIIGDDSMRKSIQLSSDAISTPLLGPYNFRIPTTLEEGSPNSKEFSPRNTRQA
ncbi:hypothetical protein A3770_06p43140 [Chloropicon primus]|uniref:Uncharacterized protein n=1 Tax=Chloropicon primus TaxID=1764295 RepID=A0A5B8MML5_9CHLO|nr:hypothetical protein A3770_06p43140 [Chloropicon primus]|eukprot:QDZ21796.1 hypothetical protein A3770_06p43140 [Chloropicon primus]